MTEAPMFDLPEEQPARKSRRSQQQEGEHFVDQIMYSLTAPYIAMPGYEDVWNIHKDDARIQRLLKNQEIFENRECTEFEAMIYLSTATLMHPPTHDWAAVYFYLFCRWSPEKAKAADIELRELEYLQIEHLRGLRRWIFRTQMNHIKSKRSSADQKEVAKEKQQLEVERPSMFDIEEGD